MFPKYNQNILNISATLMDYLGLENSYSKLNILKKCLKHNYKNIVFLICDGLGTEVIKNTIGEESFLYKHIKQNLTSVFPSTTTNATTTIMSCSKPSSHKWFGWSMYFSELDQCVDVYPAVDSYTKKPINKIGYVTNYLPFSAFYDNIKCNRKVYTVFPKYIIKGCSSNNYYFQNLSDLFAKLNKICKNPENKFIYSYLGEPDFTLHNCGTNSKEAVEIISLIQHHIQNFNIDNFNTLFIITADHGQIDISDYVEIYKDNEIMDLLCRPLSLEPRATSFKIKKGNEKKFETVFKKKYSKDFELHKVDTLIKKGVFGHNDPIICKELLGDYIAIGNKSNKLFLFSENSNKFKGHHTGISKKEMLVPLIILENK